MQTKSQKQIVDNFHKGIGYFENLHTRLHPKGETLKEDELKDLEEFQKCMNISYLMEGIYKLNKKFGIERKGFFLLAFDCFEYGYSKNNNQNMRVLQSFQAVASLQIGIFTENSIAENFVNQKEEFSLLMETYLK